MMLDYKVGRGGVKNLGKIDYVICERSPNTSHEIPFSVTR